MNSGSNDYTLFIRTKLSRFVMVGEKKLVLEFFGFVGDQLFGCDCYEINWPTLEGSDYCRSLKVNIRNLRTLLLYFFEELVIICV